MRESSATNGPPLLSSAALSLCPSRFGVCREAHPLGLPVSAGACFFMHFVQNFIFMLPPHGPLLVLRFT